MPKKAQRLAHSDQGGISTDAFTLLGADRLQCRMKAIMVFVSAAIGSLNKP